LTSDRRTSDIFALGRAAPIARSVERERAKTIDQIIGAQKPAFRRMKAVEQLCEPKSGSTL